MADFSSSIYEGKVMHHRTRPKEHRLSYNVFTLLIDLDELNNLNKTILGFGYNRFSLISFLDKDFGPGINKPLRPWIENVLINYGVEINGGKIKLLCYPRILGYVFNPICNYFCYDNNGKLLAIIHEVANTFKQKHCYLSIIEKDTRKKVARHIAEKKFYVSPFISMDMTYDFRVIPPDKKILVAIHETDKKGKLLFASFKGTRKNINYFSIVRVFFFYPLMTIKVIGGIHWEAIKIWFKGIPLVKRPEPPSKFVTLARVKNYD